MKNIFFDFETSDLNFVGQILNYAFVEVDDDWNTISSISGNVRISPTQLPTPESILSNRIDVLRHQEDSLDTEFVAMNKIHNYIQNLCETDTVKLIGYNSNAFDLHYLRTSFIRNGINPYFGGQLAYSDLFHLVTKLSLTNSDFCKKLKRKETGKYITKLETTCKSLGVLHEDANQEHESLSDVMLTIELSKALKSSYGIDIRTYDSYEVTKRYTDFDAIQLYPHYDENGNFVPEEDCILTLHDHNKSTTLWINLKKFEAGLGKKSMIWCNKNTAPLFVKDYIKDADIRFRCQTAKATLNDIKISNFWPDKACDIEQLIYTLPINEISTLSKAIYDNDLFLLRFNKNKYSNILYLRFLCNNAQTSEVDKIFTQYVLHRYGGKMRLDKNEIVSEERVYHPSYKELVERANKYYLESGDALMHNLKLFYMNSKIAKVCDANLNL